MAQNQCPEIQVIGDDGQTRRWSIGSQLLGHYDRALSRNSSMSNISRSNGNASPARPLSANGTKESQSSVSEIQRPLLRTSSTFYHRVVTDWWWWELLSWTISFLSVAAIVGLLLHFDGRKQPEHLVAGLTLNAYIAIFAAIAKAALILPVSEAIGQLKWIWFQKESRLHDFSLFDGASRGPWGSLMLLGRTKGMHLVSLGAFITVLALAFEPFFQQVVSFPARDVLRNPSRISIATTYQPGDDFTVNVGGQMEQFIQAPRSMTTVIADAVFSRENSVRAAPSNCPTGRCNWASYDTLGVCHTCQDISSQLEYKCNGTWHTLPIPNRSGVSYPCGWTFNGTFFVGTWLEGQKNSFAFMTTVVRDTPQETWSSTIFKDVAHPIVDLYLAYVPGGEPELRRNASAVLQECLFHWCVRTYNSSFQEGVLQENLISTYYADPYVLTGSGALNRTRNNGPYPLNEKWSDGFSMEKNGRTFTIADNTTRRIGQSILANLPLSFQGRSVDSTGRFVGNWDFVQTPPYDINSFFSRITEAMTNNIRSLSNNDEYVLGESWASENFVRANWLWMILPAIVHSSTLIFMVATIFESRKKHIRAWKSSAIAPLLHGLSGEAKDRFELEAPLSKLDEVAQQLQVKLHSQNGKAWLGLA